MPKAILEFNLPSDRYEHELALNGGKYLSVIQELDRLLRDKVKYAPDDVPSEVVATYDDARTMLHQLIADHDANIDI